MGAPFVVQTALSQALELRPMSTSFPNPNMSGDVLLCFAAGSSFGAIETISDSAGNTWTELSSTEDFQIWYAVANSYSGDNAVTLTPWGGTQRYTQVYLVELSNVETPPSYGSASGTGSSPTTSYATVTAGGITASVPFTGVETYNIALLVFNGVGIESPTMAIAFLALGAIGPTLVPSTSTDVFPGSDHNFSEVVIYTSGGCVGATLAQAITDLCLRAGLSCSQIDVSLLTGTNVQPVQALRGYLINRPTTAAQCLQEIMRAYFIDGCETNGTIKFVPRGIPQTPPTIPESDLGLLEDKAELTEQQAQEEDLPISTTVLFSNAQFDYQQGKQIKQRNPRILTVATKNLRVLSLPFTLIPDEARQIAEADLYSTWENRLSYKLNSFRASWALLDPTDRVQFVYEGNTYNVRLFSAQLGQGLAVGLEGVLEDYRDYFSTAVGGLSQGGYSGQSSGSSGPGMSGGTGSGGGGGTGSPPLGNTLLFLLDIPYLRDADGQLTTSGFYAALTSSDMTWGGAGLYESSDDSTFNLVQSSSVAASFGYPTTALAAPSSGPWAWDTTNSLTIQMVVGTLAGSTDAAVLAGANGLVVGSEILQFVDVVNNGGGSFTISRLLRGRRGTDNFTGSHTTGELAFAPLEGGFVHQPEPLSHLGVLWYYRGVTNNGNIADPPDVDLTLAANDLKPYSVVNISGSTDGSNDWTIAWTRRTRFGGSYGTGAFALTDGMNGPLNEQTEAYQVDIMSGATVKRTISTTIPTAVYTAAQQVTDFGSTQSSLTVNVYQMSAAIGRGWKATATLPASGATPAAPPTGDTYVN